MDRFFQAPGSRGRLNRRQIQNRDDQSPELKPTQNSYQSNAEQKPFNTPRYGAQRRLEAQKKRQQQQALKKKLQPPANPKEPTNKKITNIKGEDSKQNSTIDSKVQIENKNTGSRYSLISRQDILSEKQQTVQLNSSRKGATRYGANLNNAEERQSSEVNRQQNPSESKRRLQRKPANQRTRQQTSNQQIEKQQNQQYVPVLGKYGGNKRPILPAEKLTNEKLEEVQNIVKRPLNRKSQDITKQVEKSKKQEDPQTSFNHKKGNVNQDSSEVDKKRTVSNTFMDDIIKPIERKDRYGAQRRESEIKLKQAVPNKSQENLTKTEELQKQIATVQTFQNDKKRTVPNTFMDDIIKPIEKKDRYGAKRPELQTKSKQVRTDQNQKGLRNIQQPKKQPVTEKNSQVDTKKVVPNTFKDDAIKPIERKDRYGAQRREIQVKSKQVMINQSQEGLRKTQQLKAQPFPVQNSQNDKKRTVPNTFMDDIIKPIERKDRYGAQRRETQVKSKQGSINHDKEVLYNPRKKIMKDSLNEISIQSKTQSKQHISRKQQSQVPGYKPRRGRPRDSQIISEKPTNPMEPNNQKPKQPRNVQNRTVQRTSTPIQSQPLQKQEQAQSTQISRVSQTKINENTPNQSNRTSRVSLDNKPQLKQNDLKHRKRQNIIAFTLCRIVKLKMKENLHVLQATTQAHQNKLKVKRLAHTLSCIIADKKYDNLRHIIMQFDNNTSQITKIDHRKIPHKYELINKKCLEFLPKVISNLFKSRQRLVLNTFKKISNNHQKSLWMIGLSKLGQSSIKNAFESIKVCAVKRAVIKSMKLNQIAQIIKLRIKNHYSFAFLKLKANCSLVQLQVQKNKMQKPTRTVKPQTSPIRQNIPVSQEYNKLQKIYQSQKKQWSEQQDNQQQNLEFLKRNCSDEKQSIEQKKRKLEIIKQKIEQIHKPKKEGTQLDNISLQGTQYPLLQEIYLKVFRNKNCRIYSLNQLSKQFPLLIQDAQRDKTTQKWQTLMQNITLKSQIEKYEGVATLQRKSTEILTEQADMIMCLARNYIQEKYMWGQIKKAITKLLAA